MQLAENTKQAPKPRIELTFSYDCKLIFKSARVIILSGPSIPKFICEAWVASDRVGEGGPGAIAVAFCLMARERSERGLGMLGCGLVESALRVKEVVMYNLERPVSKIGLVW